MFIWWFQLEDQQHRKTWLRSLKAILILTFLNFWCTKERRSYFILWRGDSFVLLLYCIYLTFKMRKHWLTQLWTASCRNCTWLVSFSKHVCLFTSSAPATASVSRFSSVSDGMVMSCSVASVGIMPVDHLLSRAEDKLMQHWFELTAPLLRLPCCTCPESF